MFKNTPTSVKLLTPFLLHHKLSQLCSLKEIQMPLMILNQKLKDISTWNTL